MSIELQKIILPHEADVKRLGRAVKKNRARVADFLNYLSNVVGRKNNN